MLINEVCKRCSLTKKAVEYYIAQKLVTPSVQENGYRDFTQEDVEQLRKIAVLRNLGIPTADIREILSIPRELPVEQQPKQEQCSGETTRNSVLSRIADKKSLETAILQERQKLLQELVQTQDWDKVQQKLQQLQEKQSILERLRNAFPGYYGSYVCQHFAPYLGEVIETEQQREAYNTILAFLDSVELDIPADLQRYYDELTEALDDTVRIERLNANVRSAVCDIDKFMAEHRETIEGYAAFRQTAEYRATPAYRMEQLLRQFNSTSGYYDIFIPAMCQLSSSYREYHEMLDRADDKLLQWYPEWGGNSSRN